MLLKGKTALITGGAKGIGRAIAFRFGSEGATLILGDIDERSLATTQNDLNSLGMEVLSEECDVTKQRDIQKLVNNAIKKYGRIDILINNAGGGGNVPKIIEDIEESDWDFIMGLNLDSVFFAVQSVVPEMIKQGGGTIVNISSIAGRRGGRLGGIAYTAAKGGIISLTRHLSMTLASRNIRVCSVAPGKIASGERIKRKFMRLDKEKQQEILRKTPLGRWGTPDEVAKAVLFLASNESAYITGVTIDINGGEYVS
jgi:3-oxoacyl-[acyl-carrier protein] reductase